MAGGEGYSGPSMPASRPEGWGNTGKGGGSNHAFAGAGAPIMPPPLVPQQLIQFPYEYFKPDGSQDFMPAPGFNAGQTLAQGVVVIASYQLRRNERGVIRSVAFGVGGFVAAGGVVFQVRINGMPAPGWGALFVPPQPAAFATVSFGPDETRIDVPAAALVQLTGQITAGGPFDMFCTAHGWTWGTQGA